jgi:hypothetical protein
MNSRRNCGINPVCGELLIFDTNQQFATHRIAIELRRRLGARIPKLVLLDWIVLDPPPQFIAALKALQDRKGWQETRYQLFAMWLDGAVPA